MNNDLISRSELIDEIERDIDFERENNVPITAINAFKIAIKRAKKLPAVDAVPMDFHESCLAREVHRRFEAEQKLKDAEPVRPGRWLPKKVGAVTTEFECSECGRTVTLANDYFGKAPKYESSYYPYCHCGAKMDAEVSE